MWHELRWGPCVKVKFCVIECFRRNWDGEWKGRCAQADGGTNRVEEVS